MVRNNVVNILIERERLIMMNKNEKKHRIGRRMRGFTLVEVLIASVIVFIIGIGAISAIILARQFAEYDKQRIAAISFAREYLERTRRNLFSALNPVSDVILDNFNTPADIADDLMATVDLKIFKVDAYGTRVLPELSEITTPERVEVVVTVSWNRTGRLSSKRVSESISTYAAPDV